MRLLTAVALACHAVLLPLSAQQGPSPLIGKTVLVYNPVPGDTVLVDMSGTGYPMRSAPDNWMVLTIPATIQFHINKFGIRNNYGQGNYWLARTGISATGADAYGVADFGDGDSLWIIIDPSGPATAPPHLLTQAPKVIHVLNPWEATGPTLVLPGDVKKRMRILPEHCGWFTTFLLRPGDLQVYFEEIGGTRVYGQGGPGTRTPIDLAALFAAHPAVTTLWLDTDLNAWSPAFPGKYGYCRFLLATTVRDFGSGHPDFDFGGASGYPATGMVETALGPDRRPVRSSAPSPRPANIFNDFASWWRTDSTHASPALRSYETCVDIPMSKTGDGLWEYDSWTTPERGFYPIDRFNRHDEEYNTCVVSPTLQYQFETGLHNLNFCMESHAAFTYWKGQRFEFRGDDDLWVFINDKLVIDLGGLHGPLGGTVDLDTLGLTAGKEYKWDMFFCDRQPCTSSLRFKTSISFKQQKAIDTLRTDGAGQSFRIVKREGGDGSCAGSGAPKEVPAAGLVYQLWSASAEVMDTLAEGSHFDGGIVIAASTVTVDTAKLSGRLPQGAYRLVAFDPANSTIRIEIPIRIGEVSTLVRPGAKRLPRLKKPSMRDALGRARESRSAHFKP